MAGAAAEGGTVDTSALRGDFRVDASPWERTARLASAAGISLCLAGLGTVVAYAVGLSWRIVLAADPASRGDGGSLLARALEGWSGVAGLTVLLVAAAFLAAGLYRGPAEAGRRARRLADDLRDLVLRAGRFAARAWREEPWVHRWALLAVLAAGLLLRLLFLSQPVRYDEAFTFTHYASKPLGEALSTYDLPNNHLLHTLFVHLSTTLLGDGPVALRLPAFLAGIAAVPAAYAAIRAVYESGPALVASALTAVASPLILFSTNGRGYSFVVLAFLLLVGLAAFLRRRNNLAALALFCAVAAAALHAVPVALYPVGAAACWLFLSDRPGLRRETVLACVAVGLLTAALYLPVVQRSGLSAVVANRFVEAAPVAEFLGGLPDFLGRVWSEWHRGVPPTLTLLPGGLAIAGAREELRRARRVGRVPLGPVVLGWTLLLLFLTRRASYARIWLFLLPQYAALVGVGAAWLAGRVGGALRRDGSPSANPGPGGAPAGRNGPPGAELGGAPARRWILPVLAGLVLLAWGGSVALNRTPYWAEETGAYRDGERVARFLQERLREGDAVWAFETPLVVLEYQFERFGIPADYLNSRPAPGRRLYLVVHREGGQELERLLRAFGVSPGVADAFAPGGSFPSTEVYETRIARDPGGG